MDVNYWIIKNIWRIFFKKINRFALRPFDVCVYFLGLEDPLSHPSLVLDSIGAETPVFHRKTVFSPLFEHSGVSFLLKQMLCLTSTCLEWDNKEQIDGWGSGHRPGRDVSALCDVTTAHNAVRVQTDFFLRENW